MITQRSMNYARILYELQLPDKQISQAIDLLLNCKELAEVLENPVIKSREKDSVIDALFDKEISSFIKVLCENKMIASFAGIMDAHEELVLEHSNMLKAELRYAVKPDEEQLEQIKKMLCEKHGKTAVILETKEDAVLIGGYVLSVGNTEYDKSIKGSLSDMQKALIGR